MKRRQRNRALRNGRAKGSGHVRWTFTPNRPLARRIAAEIAEEFTRGWAERMNADRAARDAADDTRRGSER